MDHILQIKSNNSTLSRLCHKHRNPNRARKPSKILDWIKRPNSYSRSFNTRSLVCQARRTLAMPNAFSYKRGIMRMNQHTHRNDGTKLQSSHTCWMRTHPHQIDCVWVCVCDPNPVCGINTDQVKALHFQSYRMN